MFTHTMRRVAPFGWVAVALAFLYAAGIVFLRQLPPVVLAPSPSGIPDLSAEYYATEPRIAHFYASTGVVTRGEHAVVCYGTQNIESVALEPPEEQVRPALNRCFAVRPAKATTYTLHATAKDGARFSQSFTILVKPPEPAFTMISISAREIARGERWSVCYSTDNAISVRMEPNNISLPAGAKRCAMFFPTVTTQFRLTALGENGMTKVENIPTVRVR